MRCVLPESRLSRQPLGKQELRIRSAGDHRGSIEAGLHGGQESMGQRLQDEATHRHTCTFPVLFEKLLRPSRYHELLS